MSRAWKTKKRMSSDELSQTNPALDDALAQVTDLGRANRIDLPPDFAAAAVERYFGWYNIGVEIVYPTPDDASEIAPREGEWGIVTDDSVAVIQCGLFRFGRRTHKWFSAPNKRIWIYPANAFFLKAPQVRSLLSALEHVKPERLDEDGLPLPWVPATNAKRTLELRDDDEAEGEIVCVQQPKPIRQGANTNATGDVEREFARLSSLAGFEDIDLDTRRASIDKHGFVTGRVHADRTFAPSRVAITICPNSDHAEIFATLAHELAHPRSKDRGHGTAF